MPPLSRSARSIRLAQVSGHRLGIEPGKFGLHARHLRLVGRSAPPLPNMRPISPGLRFIFFIMSAICRCIFSSRLISSTLVPEPFATRRLRDAFMTLGLRRSNVVIEPMMAS